MIKVVFDTNIFISSIFWKGNPRRIIDLAVANKIKSVTSPDILQEIETVLSEDFPEIPYEKIEEIIRDILSYSHLTAVDEIIVKGLRDIKDTKIISCAVSAKADYIVTGDKDLLVLTEYKDIKILNSKAFLDLFEGSGYFGHLS